MKCNGGQDTLFTWAKRQWLKYRQTAGRSGDGTAGLTPLDPVP